MTLSLSLSVFHPSQFWSWGVKILTLPFSLSSLIYLCFFLYLLFPLFSWSFFTSLPFFSVCLSVCPSPNPSRSHSRTHTHTHIQACTHTSHPLFILPSLLLHFICASLISYLHCCMVLIVWALSRQLTIVWTSWDTYLLLSNDWHTPLCQQLIGTFGRVP